METPIIIKVIAIGLGMAGAYLVGFIHGSDL